MPVIPDGVSSSGNDGQRSVETSKTSAGAHFSRLVDGDGGQTVSKPRKYMRKPINQTWQPTNAVIEGACLSLSTKQVN